MIPRRSREGWYDLGPFTWKVERQDNHGDRSTTTTMTLTFIAHWTVSWQITRSWIDWEDDNE